MGKKIPGIGKKKNKSPGSGAFLVFIGHAYDIGSRPKRGTVENGSQRNKMDDSLSTIEMSWS